MAYIDDKGKMLKIRYFADNCKFTWHERWPKTPEGWAAARLKLREIDKRIAYAEPVTVKGTDMTTEEVIGRWVIDKTREKIDDPREADARRANLRKVQRRWELACAKNGWKKISHITATSMKAWKDGGWSVGAARVVRSVLYWSRGAPCEQVIPDAVFATITIPDGRNKDPLMDVREADLVQEKADREGDMPGLMVYLYQNYACRPMSMARARVGDVDLKAKTARLTVKMGAKGTRRHSLSLAVDPELEERFRKVVGDRPASAPLFIHPITGEAFTIEHGHYRNASNWLNRHHGATYDLKRLAMSTMRAKGLNNTQIMSITGHLSEDAVSRYFKHNLDSQIAAMEKLREKPTNPIGPSGGKTTGDGAGLELVRNAESDQTGQNKDLQNDGKIIRFQFRPNQTKPAVSD